jgi:hypothetical protein
MSNNPSSVDWFSKESLNLKVRLENKKISIGEYAVTYFDLLRQAKEMHKKEMVMFVLNVMGKYRNGDVLAEVATEFYEQTYGGGE